MSISLRGLHPVVRESAELALRVAGDLGIPVQVTSAYRSYAQQTRLRRNFEECVARGDFPHKPGCRFPANRPGDSSHNFGLGWDSWAPEGNQRDAWIYLRELIGFNVPANDHVHAEVPGWRSLVSGVTPR